MKKLQNNLYISTQGAYVHKERETIIIEVNKQKVLQVPAHSILGIYCFGNVIISPFLMGYCGESNIIIVFFTEYGRFLARIQGVQTGNVLLRRCQYKIADTKSLDIAKAIIAAKINSNRAVLMRHIRNHGENLDIGLAINKLSKSINLLSKINNLDSLRGIEGEAAATYFGVFNNLILSDVSKDFYFNGRNRRPPLDNVNALLSFLYSVYANDISAALQGVGLDPQVGFLHVERSGRDSLALDILEEFRSWLLDRLALSLINRKQLKASHFTSSVSGAVKMGDDARKIVLTAMQVRKQEEITHPYIKEKIQIGLIPHVQSLLLARHLRGDLAFYPPFLVK